MKQEMMGWQWHQLDHMQIICTSVKKDNHASTPSLDSYRLTFGRHTIWGYKERKWLQVEFQK